MTSGNKVYKYNSYVTVITYLLEFIIICRMMINQNTPKICFGIAWIFTVRIYKKQVCNLKLPRKKVMLTTTTKQIFRHTCAFRLKTIIKYQGIELGISFMKVCLVILVYFCQYLSFIIKMAI